MNTNILKVRQISLFEILVATAFLSLSTYGIYLMLEPAVGYTQNSSGEQFEVDLVVDSEITFDTPPAGVTLTPSLNGITGGVANGGTQIVVVTNNATGYQMTLLSSSTDMEGNTTPDVIPGMTASSSNSEPAYDLNSASVGANNAAFGFTVEASTTFDLDPSFIDDGSNSCGTGGLLSATDACWMRPSTTDAGVVVLNRATSTPSSGSTTTLKFRAVINPNPAPSIGEDTYVSTSTVTVTNN